MQFSFNPLNRFYLMMRNIFNAFPPFIQAFFAIVILVYIIRALINTFNRG